MDTTPNQTIDGAISTAIRQRLGTAPLGTAHAVKEALAEAGFDITPKVEVGAIYVLTAEGEDIIRDLVAHTALTQESVTAAGDALEREFDAAPHHFVRHVSGRDHAVDANALAVRDLIEANTLIASAVAVLGHEAADLIMQNLLDPSAGAAAA